MWAANYHDILPKSQVNFLHFLYCLFVSVSFKKEYSAPLSPIPPQIHCILCQFLNSFIQPSRFQHWQLFLPMTSTTHWAAPLKYNSAVKASFSLLKCSFLRCGITAFPSPASAFWMRPKENWNFHQCPKSPLLSPKSTSCTGELQQHMGGPLHFICYPSHYGALPHVPEATREELGSMLAE